MPYLYETIFFSQPVNALFSNEAIIAAMLRFEAALAKAQAIHKIIPGSAAALIEKKCKAGEIDTNQLIQDAALGGNINIPLVKQLIGAVEKENAEAAGYVHFGATSQDVIDTALVIQLKTATSLIANDLDRLILRLASLTREHRTTLMVGRTFLQQARPITFGFKTAGWLDALLRSRRAIRNLLKEAFVLQLGGAVGTLSSMGETGVAVAKTMATELELIVPPRPWHTQRDRLALIGTTLGILAANTGKMAKDLSLLMQTEVAEVMETTGHGKGGSSAMPHKNNPVGCISILANAERMPGLVATLLASMIQDHERATGPWHSEWQTITDVVQLTAGALSKAKETAGGLRVDKQQMLRNLEITKGLIYAENISLALTPVMGKLQAHELIEDCCKEAYAGKLPLKDVCMKRPEISQHLDGKKMERLFDPALSTGICEVFIDGVLSELNEIQFAPVSD